MKLEHFSIDDFKEGTELYKAAVEEPKEGEVFDVINTKGLPQDEKVLFLRTCLKHEEIINPTLIMNVILLTGGRSLDDSLFESENVIFSSLIEYIDVKQELKTEINGFYDKMARGFIGVLRGYGSSLEELKTDVPNLYWNILRGCDFNYLGKILSKVSLNIEDVQPVRNAGYLLDGLCSRNSMSKMFLNMFQDKGLI